MGRKAIAEVIGTFWLTFAGCGSVVFWGDVHPVIVPMSFGLTVVTMAYAIGHISGCHLNPAVSVGLVVSGRMPAKDLGVYVIAQVAGGILAAVMLWAIASGLYDDYDVTAKGLGANGYGDHLIAGLLAEVVMTFMFLFVILGVTSKKAPPGFAGLAIGLMLMLIHFVALPITGVSVNPARSIGPALFSGADALKELWLFIIAPPIGAAAAGFAYKALDLDNA